MKRLIALSVLLLAMVGITFAAVRHRNRSACPIEIHDSDQRRCVVLERADTLEGRQKGLSDRETMSYTHGMLFDFDQQAKQCMWMKDMRISLDMIWLDESQKITKIAEGVKPETFPESFCGEGKYVIEVNSGIARQANLKIGQKLKL